jgi:hypothetical protein
MLSSQPTYYRPDGVRIMHDPFAPGLAAKYGLPGKTDSEGFDPYADSVGAGIYGGVVKRDGTGRVVIGQQYQNHNPRPGPVYAGGGYTPTSLLLSNDDGGLGLSAWLEQYPDLVNDVSTGGAQPLHSCGMSTRNQNSAAVLIAHGADIEGLDTYGFTPLMRMASNNLAKGALALLAAGADPLSRGANGDSPMKIARDSRATEVAAVLKAAGTRRKDVKVQRIAVHASGVEDLNGEYEATSAEEVPRGFSVVCDEAGWNVDETWTRLNGGADWFKASNEAYIYFNLLDEMWWIDDPAGHGVFKAPAPAHAPPSVGWQPIGGDAKMPPACVATFREAVK